VLAVDASAEDAKATAGECRGEAAGCDVTSEPEVATLAARLGRVDVLVNNAGIWRTASLADETLDGVERVLRTNVIGTWLCTKHLAPRFPPAGGAIINLTSVMAAAPSANRGIYPASKAAIVALTQQTALEYARRGIRANAVGRGLVLTESTMPEFSRSELRDAVGGALPLRRLGAPEDVADVVAFLASDQARYITGQVLYVDGGWLAAGSTFIGMAAAAGKIP
jgi:3-oxoacyl-[acyl-carrier protein] reductase